MFFKRFIITFVSNWPWCIVRMGKIARASVALHNMDVKKCSSNYAEDENRGSDRK